MGYLLFKENDSKIFKAFLSGNEVEVGVYVNSGNDSFGAGNQVEIFYGEDTTDSYRAEIRRQREATVSRAPGKSLVLLSLVRCPN